MKYKVRHDPTKNNDYDYSLFEVAKKSCILSAGKDNKEIVTERSKVGKEGGRDSECRK